MSKKRLIGFLLLFSPGLHSFSALSTRATTRANSCLSNARNYLTQHPKKAVKKPYNFNKPLKNNKLMFIKQPSKKTLGQKESLNQGFLKKLYFKMKLRSNKEKAMLGLAYANGVKSGATGLLLWQNKDLISEKIQKILFETPENKGFYPVPDLNFNLPIDFDFSKPEAVELSNDTPVLSEESDLNDDAQRNNDMFNKDKSKSFNELIDDALKEDYNRDMKYLDVLKKKYLSAKNEEDKGKLGREIQKIIKKYKR